MTEMVHIKRITVICITVLLCCVCIIPLSAIKGMGEPAISDFSTVTEISYSKPRAKAVAAGDIQWKLTDSAVSVQNEKGLTVTKGFISLGKDNPVNAVEGFMLEVVYSSVYSDGAADENAAVLYTSDSVYNTSLYFNEAKVFLGICENGDVYYKGKKINHENGAVPEDVLNAKNSMIAPDEECTLSITYIDGRLSVSFAHGNTKKTLVNGYACDLNGLRQLQIGADKTADKRQDNITYKKVSFAVYGDLAVSDQTGTVAMIKADDVITEYSDSAAALSDALRFAYEGKKTVLELFGDMKLGNVVSIKSGTNITIDLNGYTIDRCRNGVMASNGCVFMLENGASLTIEDSNPAREHDNMSIRGGIITGGAGDDTGGGFQLLSNSVLTMNGGNITNCVSNDHGAAIRVRGSGVKVTLNNVGFYGNFTYDSSDNCHGGALYGDNDCVINMTDCIFEGNYSEDNGGAVYMNEGTIAAVNCMFLGNKCLDEGGAVYLENGTYATLDRCEYYDNRADGDGGAVYCNADEGTRMSGIFRDNSCGGNGGAVYINNDSVCIMDADIIENTAGSHGGGVYVDELYDLNVQGSVIIRGNFNASSAKDNVYLATVLMTEATIYNGGLYDDSIIFVGSYGRSHTVLKNVSSFQSRYFFSDSDDRSLIFEADSSLTEEQRLTSSAVGTGNLIFIIACSAAVAAAVIVIIAVGRKKENGEERK